MKYLGKWDINKDYKQNDLVYHNKNIYRAPCNMKKNTPIETWSIHMLSSWIEEIIKEEGVLKYKNSWEYSQEYNPNDIVEFGQVLYQCKKYVQSSYEHPGKDGNMDWLPLIAQKTGSGILYAMTTDQTIMRFPVSLAFSDIRSIDWNIYDYIDGNNNIYINNKGLYRCTYNITMSAETIIDLILLYEIEEKPVMKIINSNTNSNNIVVFEITMQARIILRIKECKEPNCNISNIWLLIEKL